MPRLLIVSCGGAYVASAANVAAASLARDRIHHVDIARDSTQFGWHERTGSAELKYFAKAHAKNRRINHLRVLQVIFGTTTRLAAIRDLIKELASLVGGTIIEHGTRMQPQ